MNEKLEGGKLTGGPAKELKTESRLEVEEGCEGGVPSCAAYFLYLGGGSLPVTYDSRQQ